MPRAVHRLACMWSVQVGDIRVWAESIAGVGCCASADIDVQIQRRHGQNAGIEDDFIVIFVRISPVDGIGVFTFTDSCPGTGGRNLDRRIKGDGREVRFVVRQRSCVVIRNC